MIRDVLELITYIYLSLRVMRMLKQVTRRNKQLVKCTCGKCF